MFQAVSWSIGLLQNVNVRLKRHFSCERLSSEGIGSRCYGDGECQGVKGQKRNANRSERLVLSPQFQQRQISSVSEFSSPQSSRLGLDTVVSPRRRPKRSRGQECLNCLSHCASLHYYCRHSFLSATRPEIVADASAYREFKRKSRMLLDEKGDSTISITASSGALVSPKRE